MPTSEASEEVLLPALALEPLDLPLQLGVPDNAKQRKRVEKHQHTALLVLAMLNEARHRAVPGARAYKPSYTVLSLIADRLEGGATREDCLHVIAAWEHEIRYNSKAAVWFTHSTPFRPDKFAEKLALEIKAPIGFLKPSVVNNPPSATGEEEFTQADMDRLLGEM